MSLLRTFTLAGVAVVMTSQASAQSFPNKPVRIVTSVAGGGGDILSRIIAPGIAASLGQPVIVDNRANVALADIVANSPPDGYTTLLVGDVLWVGPLLRGQADPLKEFSPITMVAASPQILVVHPSFAGNSVKDLIAQAKAKPGAINYASGPSGTTNHLAAELFKYMAAVNILRVPYKGGAPAIAALLGGQEVQLYFGNPSAVTPLVKSGKLKALGVTTAKPSALAPGVPTIADSGVPGYELAGIDSMYAPAKTPPAIVAQLNREIVRFLNTAEARDKLLALGGEVVANSPKEHADRIRAQIKILGNVIKVAGITAD